MSVNGEFLRVVGDTAAVLRAAAGPRRPDGAPASAVALADALERERAHARQDLPGAAARVLALWEEGEADALSLSPAARARLDPAVERMLAVSRIILGR